MRKILFVFGIALGLISCKEASKSENQQEDPYKDLHKIDKKEDIQEVFKVTYKGIFPKNDELQLFYTENYKLSFYEDKSLVFNVNGSLEEQIISYTLPNNVYPDRFRFDMGTNLNQKKIQINEITLQFKNYRIVITKENLLDYLKPNDFIDYNSSNGRVKLISKKNEGQLLYDPYFTCTPKLIKLIFEL